MVGLIQGESFKELVLNSDKPVMVDFFAQWCGPCKMIAPLIEQIEEKLEGEARIFKVDIDQNEELCEKYEISAVPSLLFFKDGECVDRVVGAVGANVMEEKLKALM